MAWGHDSFRAARAAVFPGRAACRRRTRPQACGTAPEGDDTGVNGATYSSAGVDLELYREGMARLPAHMRRTQ